MMYLVSNSGNAEHRRFICVTVPGPWLTSMGAPLNFKLEPLVHEVSVTRHIPFKVNSPLFVCSVSTALP